MRNADLTHSYLPISSFYICFYLSMYPFILLDREISLLKYFEIRRGIMVNEERTQHTGKLYRRLSQIVLWALSRNPFNVEKSSLLFLFPATSYFPLFLSLLPRRFLPSTSGTTWHRERKGDPSLNRAVFFLHLLAHSPFIFKSLSAFPPALALPCGLTICSAFVSSTFVYMSDF